jgi:hypothetical protein
MIERRTARRYDLSLPVTVRGPVDGNAPSPLGRTRNISTGGVYFTIDNDLSPGAELNVSMTLPLAVASGAEVSIEAIGKVLRVDRRSSGDRPIGTAVVIERYEIIRNQGPIA